MTATNESLRMMMRALADRCDGAELQDGSGFNKPDSLIGQWVASMPVSEWDDSIASWARSRADRYSRQLRRYGYAQALADLPAYEDDDPWLSTDRVDYQKWVSAEKQRNALKARIIEVVNVHGAWFNAESVDPREAADLRFAISWSKFTDADSRAIDVAVKALPGRKYDWDNHRWLLTLSEDNAMALLTTVAAPFDFNLSTDAGTLLSRCVAGDFDVEIVPPEKLRWVRVVSELDADNPQSHRFAVSFDKPNDERGEDMYYAMRYFPRSQRRWARELAPDGLGGAWAVEPTGDNIDQLVKIVTDYDFNVSEAAQALFDARTARKAHLSNLYDMSWAATPKDPDAQPDGFRCTLYPFQLAGIEYIEVSNGRCILGDDMGLGKTKQVLGYMQKYADISPVVVVAPAAVMLNWEREIRTSMSLDTLQFACEGRTPRDLTMIAKVFRVFLVSWDNLRYWLDDLIAIKPQLVALDEAHRGKNRDSKRSRAATTLAHAAPRVIAMTGTPVKNRPVDAYALLNQVAPADWSNFEEFEREYAESWDGLDRLHHKMREYMVRRTKEQVLTDLPPKVFTTVPVRTTPNEMVAYRIGVRKAIEELLKKHGQISHLAIVEKTKQLAWAAKRRYTIEWIKDFLDLSEADPTNGSLAAGPKLVVFTTHKDVVQTIEKAFPGITTKVTGDVTGQARQNAVDTFQNDDNCRLFIGNLTAASEGITLTAASNVAFVEFGWTPGEHDQAADRCHRIGQKSSVQIWNLAAKDTIDEQIVALIDKKRTMIDTVTDAEKATKRNETIYNDLLLWLQNQA